MQNNKIAFMISKYILENILPKCNLAYGEIFTAVYLQISLYTNNSKSSNEWEKNSCWLNLEQLSKNTGYSVRNISECLKKMRQIKLIETLTTKNNSTKYTLINNNIFTLKDLKEFNKTVDYKLCKIIPKNKLEYFNNFSKDSLRKVIFKDVSFLRRVIKKFVPNYKGSTLFFINEILLSINNNKKYLNNLSQEERALKLGVKQSTVSRYLKYYTNLNLLEQIKTNPNVPMQFKINYDFFNLKKEVEKMICPICDKDFSDIVSLNIHIAKTKDPIHKMLNFLKKQRNDMSIMDLYNTHYEDFQELKNEYSLMHNEDTKELVQSNQYLKVSSDCTISCKECYKKHKDTYNACNQDRKEAFNEEFNLNEKQIVKTANVKEKPIKEKKPKKEKPVKEKKVNTSPELVNYFYNQTGGVCPSYPKECGQVKRLLEKYSFDEIKIAIDFLVKKGDVDLRFINSSIANALLENQYLSELNTNGTYAYLVNTFYTGLKQKLNRTTLVREINKLKELIASGYSYDDLLKTIDYMIDIKCTTFNFIGSKVTEALNNKKQSLRYNPCYNETDDDRIRMLKSQLSRCNYTIDSPVDEDLKREVDTVALHMYKNSEFIDSISHWEWAFRVKLNLTKELYDLGKTTSNREISFDDVINYSNDEDDINEAIKLKREYEIYIMDLEEKYN